ncbi:YodL domain-containing protein [Ruminococcus sp.]|uniref:YodL domain-containing protein n=1 Tax=Ruminococcus sp. TaxID=41978 RepID=UPI0025FED5DF|nr:YodL domain-containing protein [Ruminococcus sp.]MBR1430149.1 hypothetical protein [Ruminococcus sp.]
MFIEPKNIMGVIAFPNPNGVRDCYFVDVFGNELFKIPDGDDIKITYLEGQVKMAVCKYIDDCHFAVGTEVYHKDQFAEVMERIGAVYEPLEPKDGDVVASYEIYQIKDMLHTDYTFRCYDAAAKSIKKSDYKLVYRNVYHPKTSLEKLFIRHNGDYRPYSDRIRSMSVSDVIVITVNGEKKAYYVDSVGFEEIEDFDGRTK